MRNYDYLIVGAGLYGSLFAYLAQSKGKRCLVIDKRPHIGGNLYCELREGIHVHKYGPHIFHTSNKDVWDYVNSLVPFNRFTNAPLASYNGQLYHLPFNMNTFYQMWGTRTPAEAQQRIEAQRREALIQLTKEGGQEPRNLEEQALLLVGHDIYETLIKEYTEKQWGRKCTDLPPFIIKRLPVRFSFDNNYFNDAYQGIPMGGYNPLIEKLLNNVETKTSVDFFADRNHWEHTANHIVYTGPVDQFFDYEYGILQWRTVRFDEQCYDIPNFQGNAVINYTQCDVPYTRSIEHKHFERFGNDIYDLPKTIVSREYPEEWTEGKEPFYPVNDATNNRIYSLYAERAHSLNNVTFGGRLAEYRYYDMAPLIEKLLQDSSQW